MSEPLKNPRHEMFCQATVFEALAPADAYLATGGTSINPGRAGKKWSLRADIRNRIAALQQDKVDAHIEKELYDREYVVRQLMENVDEAKRGLTTHRGETVYLTDEGGRVVRDGNGKAVPVYKREGQVINKALELLGLEIGMFPKQMKLEEKRDPFDGMTTEQILVQLRSQLQTELGWTLEIGDLEKLIGRAKELDAGSATA